MCGGREFGGCGCRRNFCCRSNIRVETYYRRVVRVNNCCERVIEPCCGGFNNWGYNNLGYDNLGYNNLGYNNWGWGVGGRGVGFAEY
jgi:hypothetical protein